MTSTEQFTHNIKLATENPNNHQKNEPTIEIPIEIPSKQAISEHSARILLHSNLGKQHKDRLAQSLQHFLSEKTQNFYDSHMDDICDKFSENFHEDDFRKHMHKFSSVNFKLNDFLADEGQFRMVYGLQENGEARNSAFSKRYHELIHSEFMPVILMREREYMIEVNDLIVRRDRELSHLEMTNSSKLNEALKLNGNAYVPDQYVAKLANDHVDEIEMRRSECDSHIMNLKENQKRRFHEWIVGFNANLDANKRLLDEFYAQASSDFGAFSESSTNLEESFTIQLGTQLKSTHNLRLIKCDLVDYLCASRFNLKRNLIEPQATLTAMSLNSNAVCAGVLLVDRKFDKFNDMSRRFAAICEESTEYHFQTFEQQLIKVGEFLQVRQNAKMQPDGEGGLVMNMGDVYLTKHSNLSKVHLMFHLAACDDSLRQKSDISSRHPVILGLRNILKACCRYNITTLTLPLLLAHEMSEEMTINWVMRRAELVLKCLKGFMIEFVQWGASESRNLQFVVPKSLMDETFISIRNLIPTIFRESRTVNLPVLIKQE